MPQRLTKGSIYSRSLLLLDLQLVLLCQSQPLKILGKGKKYGTTSKLYLGFCWAGKMAFWGTTEGWMSLVLRLLKEDRILCDSGSRSTTLGEGEFLEVEAVFIGSVNLESMLGNLPSIHLEFEELELDRRELITGGRNNTKVEALALAEPGLESGA
ncbi:hypothetical protein Tco_0053338 [Tanacetum coccineum]